MPDESGDVIDDLVGTTRAKRLEEGEVALRRLEARNSKLKKIIDERFPNLKWKSDEESRKDEASLKDNEKTLRQIMDNHIQVLIIDKTYSDRSQNPIAKKIYEISYRDMEEMARAVTPALLASSMSQRSAIDLEVIANEVEISFFSLTGRVEEPQIPFESPQAAR